MCLARGQLFIACPWLRGGALATVFTLTAVEAWAPTTCKHRVVMGLVPARYLFMEKWPCGVSGLWVEVSRLYVVTARPCVGLSLKDTREGLQVLSVSTLREGSRKICAAPPEDVQDGEGHVLELPEWPTLRCAFSGAS